MRFTIGGKFASLLTAFLALQVLQLGIGIYQVRHVAEEAEHLGGVGRLRPAFLAELARRSLAAGGHRPVVQQQLRDALAAQDDIYQHLEAAFGKKINDPEYADIARSVTEAHDIWEKDLQPLIQSVDPARPEAARAALARYGALFPAQAGRLAQIVKLLEQHLHEEIRVAKRNHASIFVLSMLLALIAAWAVRRHAVAPLRALAKVSQAIAGGNLDQHLSIASSDEIGQLAGAFNDMATNLEVRHQQVAAAVAELRANESKLAEAQRMAKLGSWELNLVTNVLAWSDEIYRIFEIDPATFGASYQAFLDTIHPDDRELVNGAYNQSVKNKMPYDIEHRLLMKDGRIKYVHERSETFYDDRGKPLRSVGTVQDVTERRQAEERLRHMHFHDELTGLPNRELLLDRLEQAVIEAQRHGREVAVLCLDIDRFKFVNETHGHVTGDTVLKAAAARLKDCVRPGDTVARLGGDEFAVALSDIAHPDDVGKVVSKIMHCADEPLVAGDNPLYVTLSVGITLFPLDGDDPETLLKNAAVAMYQAKQRGGHGYQYYSTQMAAAAAEHLALENSLRLALERREFLLHYQPQVNLQTGRVTGVEALIRWRHPELGLVPPMKFIPLAEETGLIVPIGEWVLRTACAQARAWREAGLPALRVAVNFSAQQFRQPGLDETVKRILQETKLDPYQLDIELTESTLAQNPETVSTVLQNLEQLGVQISIDDFGTGYSSLSYLKRFPVDVLKIDQSFVREAPRDSEDAAIVIAIISMAHALGIQTIAEGVETEEQIRFLRHHGCGAMQGYYFSKPLPVEDVAALLRENRGLAAKE